MLRLLLLCLGGIQANERFEASSGWTYLDSAHWPREFPACNGNMQSPIDIKSVRYDPSMPMLHISMPREQSVKVRLKNNGHTLRLAFPKNGVQMEGATLPDAFGITQIHMHFGENDKQGSEHALFGQKFPMEMHWVSEELAVQSQFAIFATLFEIGEASRSLDHLLSFVSNLTESHKEIEIDLSLTLLKELLPVRAGTEFYCYHGSLTTPPCTQTVEWILAARQLTVSSEQMKILRSLRGHGNQSIAPNFRPVQPQMWRGVYSSFSVPSSELESVPDRSSPMLSKKAIFTPSLAPSISLPLVSSPRSSFAPSVISSSLSSPLSPSPASSSSSSSSSSNNNNNTSVAPLFDPCVDDSSSCPAWALDGRCSQEWVIQHCRLSCHVCLPRTCEDDNDHCGFWRDQGLCRRLTNSTDRAADKIRDRWVNFVVHHCPRSCGSCPTLGGVWAKSPERAAQNAQRKDDLVVDNAARTSHLPDTARFRAKKVHSALLPPQGAIVSFFANHES